MPEDVAIRDQARGVAAKYPAGSVEAGFYNQVAGMADDSIARLRQRFIEETIQE
jgi:hypothetical protein